MLIIPNIIGLLFEIKTIGYIFHFLQLIQVIEYKPQTIFNKMYVQLASSLFSNINMRIKFILGGFRLD